MAQKPNELRMILVLPRRKNISTATISSTLNGNQCCLRRDRRNILQDRDTEFTKVIDRFAHPSVWLKPFLYDRYSYITIVEIAKPPSE